MRTRTRTMLLAAGWLLACEPTQPRSTDERPAAVAPPPAEPTHEQPAAPPELEPDEPPAPCKLVAPPPGFVDLREHIPSAIIVAGYHRTDNFTGAPLPGYEAPGAWLARDAAEALANVATRLQADGLRLIIYDAYRPRRASVAMVAWSSAHGRNDLLEDGWVAAHSAHGLGRAVDIGLADANGTALDMGSEWDQFDRRSHLRGVEGPALDRRLRLRDELRRVGFEPYAREWWHFTFPRGPARALDIPYVCDHDRRNSLISGPTRSVTPLPTK